MSSPRRHDDGLAPNGHTSVRHLSRSPHPYHRTGSKTSEHLSPKDPTDRPLPSQWSRSPSESGTEADDESTGILKGLPAPPIRPRKGLKSGRDGGNYEPGFLAWPSGRSASRSPRRSSGEGAESGIAEEREKVRQKRRVEVFRRISETVLLVAVGGVVLWREDTRLVAWLWRNGVFGLI